MTAAAHVSYPADGVGLVLLDNPPWNFGSYELLEEVEQGVNAVEQAGCRVVILASDVPGYFMAHAYLPDLVASASGSPVTGDPRVWRRLTEKLDRGRMISIAANNGQAWGGGGEISWACNLRIAAESATYGQLESFLGLSPGAGATVRLTRHVGQAKALEMMLLGTPISAREALAIGAANRVVPDDRLRAETIAIAAAIAARPRWALDAAKRSIQQGWDLPQADALRNEGFIYNTTVSRPETLEILRRVQARYDAGAADSYEAAGI